jgi:NAD(P)-dependent dehydrogenase (short-subunit alcohol dehydrogenase family)
MQLEGGKTMASWTAADIPPQNGRRAVVTGGAGGLGYQSALALAGAGAEVFIADVNADKGNAAVASIVAAHAGAWVHFELLDLANLKSVSALVDRLAGEHKAIDLLINNAGVMDLPHRRTTVDGFEMQLGINYLGHFALTAGLLPLLRRGRQARVVSMSSLAHRWAVIELDDLQLERSYTPDKAYRQSKLAMLMFAQQLQRRSDAAGWGVASMAAHPGWARTNLFVSGPEAEGRVHLVWRVATFFAPLWSNTAEEGARPALFAATSPEARGGGYYGPGGYFEMKGSPAPADLASQAKDAAVAAKLWEVSVRLTGASFPAY